MSVGRTPVIGIGSLPRWSVIFLWSIELLSCLEVPGSVAGEGEPSINSGIVAVVIGRIGDTSLEGCVDDGALWRCSWMVKLERRLAFCKGLVGDDIEAASCRDFIVSGVSECSCRGDTEGK
jgi:hypothetical protein